MRLLSRVELKTVKGVNFSRSQLGRLIKAGKFPKPVKLGENRNAWPDAEIDHHIAKLIAERDGAQAA